MSLFRINKSNKNGVNKTITNPTRMGSVYKTKLSYNAPVKQEKINEKEVPEELVAAETRSVGEDESPIHGSIQEVDQGDNQEGRELLPVSNVPAQEAEVGVSSHNPLRTSPTPEIRSDERDSVVQDSPRSSEE